MTVSLVGRDAEVARVQTWLDQTAKLRGGLLQVRGPAGIGKSALLDVVVRRAAARGMTVLRASGAARTQQVSFEAVRALFGTVAAGLTPVQRAAAFGGAAWLAEPVVTGQAGEPSLASDIGFARREGLYWFTANLARRRPLAIVVDDLQWVDDPSTAYLTHLAQRLNGTSVLLVTAVRDDNEGTGERDRARTPGNTISGPTQLDGVVRLAPLTHADVATLLRSRLRHRCDEDVVARAIRVTGGIPFLVHEFIRSLDGEAGRPDGLDRPDDADPTDGADRVNGPMRDPAVIGRVRRLGSDARAVAQALAVLGTDTGTAQLEVVAELSEGRRAVAVAQLRAAGLVEGQVSLRFVHPLVHAAVDEQLPDAERRRLHARAARLLASRAAPHELVAVHVLASAPGPGAWAVRMLRAAAADAMAQGAPERAVELYEHAVALSDYDRVPAALLAELGAAQASAGVGEQATATFRLALAHATDPVVAAGTARALAAHLIRNRSTAVEAVEILSRSVESLPPQEHAIGQLLEADIETAAFVSLAAREAAGRRARSEFTDPDARQTLAGTAMRCAMETGPAADAAGFALRALDDGQLLTEEGPESPTFWLAALALIFAQGLITADAVLTEAATLASSSGSRVGAGMVACFRSCLDLSMGRVGDAEASARRFLELTPTAFALGPAFLVQALLERGELDEAHQLVTAEPEPDLDSAMSHFLLRSRAAAHRAAGNLDAAASDLRALASGAQAWQSRTPGPLLFEPMLAEVLHQRGETDEARELLAATLDSCRAFGADVCTGVALRTAALLADDPDERLELATRSVRLLANSAARLECARSLVIMGQVRLRRAELRDARDPLRRGLQLARRCGATALALTAHRGLTEAGLRPRKIVEGGVDALTASERRVCVLVRDGLSNREVAEHLFVTVRTVETHLDRSYKKLGVHTRSALRQALRETTPLNS